MSLRLSNFICCCAWCLFVNFIIVIPSCMFINPFHHHHHHKAAVVSRGRANASACRLQITLSCAVLRHIVSLQYLSRSSLHRLAGLPCRIFLSYSLQVVIREVHRSSLRRLICPAQDHFIFLTVLIISMSFSSPWPRC